MPNGRADTRQRMLEVSRRLFCERGFTATNVNAIVGEMGLTPPALYHHFGSKDGLLRAVVDPLVDALDDLVAEPPAPGGGVDDRLRLLESYLDILIRWRPVVCFLLIDPAVRHHPEVGVRLDRQQNELQSALANTVKPAAPLAAAAALGAVWRPVTSLDEPQLVKHSDTIVAAGLAAFGAAQTS